MEWDLNMFMPEWLLQWIDWSVFYPGIFKDGTTDPTDDSVSFMFYGLFLQSTDSICGSIDPITFSKCLTLEEEKYNRWLFTSTSE